MVRDRGFGRPAAILVVVAFFAVVAIARGDAQQATPTATPAVSSQILGTGLPPAAPGETLYLYRAMIEPGARIVPHTHPGTQVASIVAGELTYTVIQGEVTVTRAASGGTPGPTEHVMSGQEVVLRPGDSLVEQIGMIHQARNDGGETVVILISSLFRTGEPLSRPADVPATPATDSADRTASGDVAAVQSNAVAAMPAPALEIQRQQPYHVSGQYGAAEGRGRQSTKQCVRENASAVPATGTLCLALMR